MSRPGWMLISKVLTSLGYKGRTGRSHLIFTCGEWKAFKRITVPSPR